MYITETSSGALMDEVVNKLWHNGRDNDSDSDSDNDIDNNDSDV